MKKHNNIDNDSMEQLLDKKENLYNDVSVGKIIGTIIFIIFIIFAIVNIGLGFFNFKQINTNQKPYLLISEKEYSYNEENVKVYNFGVYKIVTRTSNTKETISLKMWFMDDVKS